MSKLSQFMRGYEKWKEIIEQLPQSLAALDARQTMLAEQITALRGELAADSGARQKQLENRLSSVRQTVNMVAAARPARARIKAVFLIHHIEAWDSLGDIYDLMRAADDFEPILISIKRCFPGDAGFGFEEVVHEKLEQLALPHLRFSMENSYEGLDILKALAPDIIFKQSQWDRDVPPAFAADELRFAKLCYVPYFVGAPIEMQALGNSGDIEVDSPLHRAAWKIFYPTEDQKSRFEKYAARRGDNVEIVGHPKVKRLARLGAEKPHWPIGDLLPRRFRLIWAPHHSIDKNWLNFGMFPAVYKDMLEWAKTDSGIDIVLHPHPAALARIMEGKDGVSREECEAFLQEWDSLPNTARWAAGNYAGLMQASDCMLTDGLSFLAEYQFFTKPVIFLERPDHLPFSEAGKRIVKGVHAVENVRQARELAHKFAAGYVDTKAAEQRDNTAWLAGDKLAAGTAAERIVASIRRGLRE